MWFETRRLMILAAFAALTTLRCASEEPLGAAIGENSVGGSNPGAGGAAGGVSGASGGAVSAGGVPTSNGGAPSGSGGIPSGNGGSPPENGGGPSGNGGSPSSSGGAVAASGGAATGSGGIVTSSGGAVQASGGEPPYVPPVVGGDVDPVGNANRAPGFVNLAPPAGTPFPATGSTLNPAAPSGWEWHPVDGAKCRDGSPTGIFLHTGLSPQLVIFLEGGGACSNVGFCRFNPRNANEVLAGDGSTVLGSAGGAIGGRQQPGAYSNNTPAGIFDFTNLANPFWSWSVAYVPYCTGDVHFGTRADAKVPGTPGADARDLQKHQFLGYRNMEKIVARLQPTFKNATKVVVTGSSAGSFGAALNFSMIQDAFGDTPVTIVGDSGVPFSDQYMYACMQKKWRETWGLALPPDCTECQQADGAGLLGLADFLIRKHPKTKLAIVSTMQDEVMRLFFSVGLKSCANYEKADPVEITLTQFDPTVYMPADQYTGGLNALLDKYKPTGRMATFYMSGQVHQHIFRPSFYTSTAGGLTLAQFVGNFVNGTVANVGP